MPDRGRRAQGSATGAGDVVFFSVMTALLGDLADDLESAFPRLVHEHQGLVFATALRCTGRRDLAEEIAQEAFVRAYRNLQTWPRERIEALRLRPWLARITLNLARNLHRDAARRPVGAALDDGLADHARSGAPEAAALRGERRALLAGALDRLPETQRIPVVLRHVTGLRFAEIAEATDRPVGTVKAQVHRGLRRLADLVDPVLLEGVS